ncbi:uncharacterized protein LOC130667601 [Microplitis mediator]|uniref:uncharacterized protein LOC130667601 n=1 Tax=Microplitis mediator TaxID=375433 RepID=UPI0025533FB6|nr:uncharacterized protein LOC130667601 [Microplitis mediator]
MRIHKFIKLFLYFIIFNCVSTSGWNIKSEENDYSELSGILTHVLESCNNNFRKIVINGNADENIIKSIRNLESVGVILHENSLKVDPKLVFRHKVGLFVVSFDESVDELVEILHTFKKSPWWNVMTPYFVLSGSKNGCSDAQTVLQTVWKMNILNCYFVCLDSQQKPFIYTFNPYSKYAPDQWKFVEELKNGSNYMAIYNRPFKKENICKGFNFDRTKYLDRTTVNAAFCITENKTHLFKNTTDKSKFYKFSSYDSRITSAIKTALKVSLKYDYDLRISGILTSKLYGVYILLEKKTSDVVLCSGTQPYLLGFPGSYQISYSGFTIFSRNRGFKTPLEKMYKFYGPLMIAATIIISTITYFVIWYVNKPRGHSFAVFEILRLWTSNSLYTKIDTLALRIFFFVIFLYFLILQATFQGHLSKFLTNPELRDNAESLPDLRSSFYEKIYITRSSELFITDYKILKSKSKSTSFSKCMDAVLHEKSSVCISNHLAIMLYLDKLHLSKDYLQKFYLSPNFLRNTYYIFTTRHDWPLKQKFDYVLQRLENTGILQKINNNLTAHLESSLFYAQLEPEFRPIDLESLLFIFYFLIFGLSAATFCFILEKYNFARNKKIIIDQKNQKKLVNKNNRRRKNRKRIVKKNITAVQNL